MDDWVLIRDFARQGLSRTEIARRTGRDAKTIRKVLSSERPPLARRAAVPRTTKLTPFLPYLDERVAQGCLNASVLGDELRARGYTGGITQLRGVLHPYRLEACRQREATTRFETAPGHQAQVDWGDFGRIWVPEQERWAALSGFVFTLSYSRAAFLTFTLSEDLEHFLAAHIGAFTALGVPQEILYDNLKTAILGRQPSGAPLFPGRFLDFALYYGFTPRFCRPYRPRTKGKVERGIGYVRQNFWLRVAVEVQAGTLALPALNERATAWIEQVALPRVHGSLGEVVAERLARERPLLGSVVGRMPYDTAYQVVRRVSRDGRFSYRGHLYQIGLRHALSTVTLREPLVGELTVHAADGSAVRVSRVDLAAPALPEPEPATAPAPGDAPRLPAAPAVATRSLAVYEEVAYAASGA